jgi:hypothetical protein
MESINTFIPYIPNSGGSEMKKIVFAVIAASMLLISVAGQAMAYFEEGHLMRIVYDRTSGVKEVGTDLGVGWNTTTPIATNHLFNDNNFTLSMLNEGTHVATLDNTYVAYFAYTQYNPTTGAVDGAWTSGPVSGQVSKNRKWQSFLAGGLMTQSGYYTKGVPQFVMYQSDNSSYAYNYYTYGSFAGFIPGMNGDQNLAALATTGYVDQYLYYYSAPNTAQTGVDVYQIRTYANGTTEINPVNPVPVPAAIYLFGSGLLGLIGIRRRMAV